MSPWPNWPAPSVSRGGRAPELLPNPADYFDNWWHSEDNVVSTGGVVDSWTDVIAGRALTATLTRRPAIAANAAYGNLPLISFDGVNDNLRAASGVEIIGLRPFSAWWIGDRSSGIYLWGNYTTTGWFFMCAASATSQQVQMSPTGGIISSGAIASLANPHSYLWTIAAGGAYVLYQDGVSVWSGTVASPTTGAALFFTLGSAGDAAFAACRYTDFAVNRGTVLTADDAAALHEYAQATYGIA